MIFLYSDILFKVGGIETYLHSLALHLQSEELPFRVAVCELETCPLVDELVSRGVKIYRQRRIPGDRWLMRQRVLQLWLLSKLKPGDWVFCLRRPSPQLYLGFVRAIHRRKARLAVSWMFAPEFETPHDSKFAQAVSETDAVLSVARCTAGQFNRVYGYKGRVHVVPYHNLLFFQDALGLPPGPPWKIGYMGRLERKQKNLADLITAFADLAATRSDVELHLHGRGPDETFLREMVSQLKLEQQILFHGPYDHRRDLPGIMQRCHFFVYPSRFEGGPCFSLLELLQAGRFCVASRVGGIPDLYENHPDLGTLVEPGDKAHLQAALADALDRLARGAIDGERIRARYFEAFDLASAHRAWSHALGLANQ